MNKLMMIVTLMVVACGLMSEAQVQQEGTESLDQERLLERLSAQERELDELRALLQAERIRQNVSCLSTYMISYQFYILLQSFLVIQSAPQCNKCMRT